MTTAPTIYPHEHANYKRSRFSQFAVMAVGHQFVAFFEQPSESHRYAVWLASMDWIPISRTIAEYDTLACAGLLFSAQEPER
jgi:hypothetical protein